MFCLGEWSNSVNITSARPEEESQLVRYSEYRHCHVSLFMAGQISI